MKKEFCKKLKDVMKKKSITVTDLSKSLQISRTSIYRLLNPDHCSTIDSMKRIADLLGIKSSFDEST